MSWLENALEEDEESFLCSADFHAGDFDLIYAPTQTLLGPNRSWVGSPAIRHLLSEGLIFRYKLLIKRTGGEFVQWGAEGNECHPPWEESNKWFSHDVQRDPAHGAEPQRQLCIFGLKHEDLVKSEWVENDTLTVKVQVEDPPNKRKCPM